MKLPKNAWLVLALIAALILLSVPSFSQITGLVYRDINASGTRQTANPNEPGEFGVIVNAYSAANALLASTATDANGNYAFPATGANSIAAGTAVRLEFIGASDDAPSKRIAGGSGNIQFKVAGAAVTADYAIAYHGWYSNSANPTVAITGSTNGDPTLGGTAGTNNNLYLFPYDLSGVGTQRRPNSELGSVYGMTWQPESRTLIMAAYLKRHVGFGLSGIGAIYKSTVNLAGTPSVATLLVNVSSIGINVGTSPRGAALPAASNTTNTDLGVFSQIGKRGIGGIDLSENGRDLYFVNLFENKIHRITIGNPVKASITAADVTGTWTTPTPTGVGSAVWHPMGIKVWHGKVYVGGVTALEGNTATTIAADTVNLKGIVYELNPATGTFTEVLRFPLSRRRGYSNGDHRYDLKNNYWRGWQNNGDADVLRSDLNTTYLPLTPNTTNNTGIYYPQPMLSDIEFDVDGSMIVALRDRFGDQAGYQNLMESNNPAAIPLFRALTSGEMLRAGKTSNVNSWTLENSAQVTTNAVTTTTAGMPVTNPALSGTWNPATGTPWGGTYGPGGKYYYYNHNFETNNVPAPFNAAATINAHFMKTVGGIAFLPGSNEIMMATMDPVATAYANGISKHTNKTNGALLAGNMSARLQLVATNTGANDPGNMGKANGLGDLEILVEAMPVELGHRIWNDANGNGIQDAGEAGITGISVVLRSPGVDGIYGNGDDQIWTVITDATGNYYFDASNVNDTRRPVAWTGVSGTASGILPGYEYRVEIDGTQGALAGLKATKANLVGNAYDAIDNDGILNGTSIQYIINAGGPNAATSRFENIYDADFGFTSLNSMGDRVWRDDNANGVQDAGEPGVAGITVTLYNNGTDNLPSTADDFVAATAISDAYGNYYFENIANGNYNLSYTLPANYQFTSSTGTDDVNATNSDANATTGRTGTIIMTGGESENDVDAGLIFTQSTSGSIGDRVWFDANSNGVQDANEAGMSGVTVTLYNNVGAVLATTVTDANGTYTFSNLGAGNYSVGITLPAGFIFSTKDAGGNDNIDSDINTTGVNFGRTDNFALGANETRTNTDIGIIQAANSTASVGDWIWNDLNQNGIQDAGEPGVAGVTLTLYFNGALVTSTVTDAFGHYVFTNIASGNNYQVRITLPSGYVLSAAKVGSNIYVDNDFLPSTLTNLFFLSPGLRNLTIDGGIYQSAPSGTARFSGFTWFDTDADGVQDAGEVGLPGIVVTLYNNAGTAIASTTSDINGNYYFVNLAAGNYSVGFSNIPPGYSPTPIWVSDDANATNSDASPLTGRTGLTTLTAGENETDFDAGFVAGVASGLGTIGDKVFYDLNNNGLQDAGEGGVARVTVTLRNVGPDGILGNGDDGATVTTTTNALGEFSFAGLAAGNYVVDFSSLPAGFVSSPSNVGTNDRIDSDGGALGTGGAAAGTSRTGVITIVAGEDKMDTDFGIFATGTNSLGNFVWNDLNGNGVQNVGEPGIPGVLVILLDGSGNAVDGNSTLAGVQPYTTVTDANGQYLFAGLADGTYKVRFSNLPAGFYLSLQDNDGTPGNGITDSDPERTSGVATPIATLNAGNRNDNSIDAGGMSTLATLGNSVWSDLNGNGIQDIGEPGLSGVTVSLFFDANNDGDFADAGENLPIASTVSDRNGVYNFAGLQPGNYQALYTTIPTGYSFTQQINPGDNGDNTNSDADRVTGRTGTFVLSAGESELTMDAGLFKPQAVAGNFVWADTNGNGIQDAGEPGLPGIAISLYDAVTNIPISVVVSDGAGGYMFGNVPPGNYYIIAANLPASGTFTSIDAGGNDNLDSDVNPGTGRTANLTIAATATNLSFDIGVITNLSALPVKIEVFTATKKLTTVEVDWKVGVEDNLARYEIEYSKDGSSFTKIGEVKATGLRQYSFVHNNPATGANYYRLKSVDIDGKISYSEVRKVNFESIEVIKLYPNPATSVIRITIPTKLQGKQLLLVVHDVRGGQVIRKNLDSASDVESLNVGKLSMGRYYLTIDNTIEKTTKAFEVIR